MKRVLFFNPYTPWTPHLLWEATIAYALRQRGHKVQFVTCNGLPDCGMVPARGSEDRTCCSDCHVISGTITTKLRQKVEFMQSGVTASEQAEIRRWIDSVDVEELRSARYCDLPVGEWTWSDMLTYWHSTDPMLDQPAVAKSYRDLIYGAAVATVSMPRLYDRFQPDVVVTLNGAFFLQRVAVETAWRRGIRTVAHERGWRDNTVTFRANGLAGDLVRYQEWWDEWKETPLTAAELCDIHDLLSQRRSGQNMNWSAFTVAPQEIAQIRSTLGLLEQPMALLCTSSDCEGSILDRMGELTQWDWIKATVAWFRQHPEYTLVIRVHPNELEHSETDDRPLRRYIALKAEAPANVRVILPDEKVSTYTLMDIAAVGLSYGSTAGLEMATLGLPVVHSGVGMYRDCGFMEEIRSQEEVPSVMERVMRLPKDPKTRRMAYRYLHLMYIRLCVPFPAVRVSKDYYNAEPAYDSTAELAPGRDPYLDAIAEYILGESELYPGPAQDRRALLPADEDAFFARLDG